MAKSPTGIKTEAFIWLRGVQLLFGLIIFVTGCIEQSRWISVVALFLPIMLFTLLILLDTVIFYKYRYAKGAGRVSTLRWVADFFMCWVLGAAIPTLSATYRYVRYTEEGSGPYDVPQTFYMVELAFIIADLLLFVATFIMLCMEDVRMRKRRGALQPSATTAMPQIEEQSFDVAQEQGALDADRASMLMNNILANGFTVEQLEKMSVRQSRPTSTVTTIAKPEFVSRPPTYHA